MISITKFSQLIKDIKSIKIQGARNIAVAGVKAMSLKGFSKKKILSARPTEPMLRNAIASAERIGQEETLKLIKKAREKTIKYGIRKVKKTVFTHCHSSSVIAILTEAHKKGKRFEVFNTETMPRYQGRKTTRELAKAGINVTTIVDSAAGIALRKTRLLRKTDAVFLGADAILKDGSVINKVGSGMFAEIAYHHRIPVYIIANAWKYSPRDIKIELREREEIWKNAPKNIKIKNPAFETIDSKHITAVISELGVLSPKKFIKRVRKKYRWIK